MERTTWYGNQNGVRLVGVEAGTVADLVDIAMSVRAVTAIFGVSQKQLECSRVSL